MIYDPSNTHARRTDRPSHVSLPAALRGDVTPIHASCLDTKLNPSLKLQLSSRSLSRLNDPPRLWFVKERNWRRSSLAPTTTVGRVRSPSPEHVAANPSSTPAGTKRRRNAGVFARSLRRPGLRPQHSYQQCVYTATDRVARDSAFFRVFEDLRKARRTDWTYGLESVKFGEELIESLAVMFVLCQRAAATKSIDFVDEENARTYAPRLCEQLPQSACT